MTTGHAIADELAAAGLGLPQGEVRLLPASPAWREFGDRLCRHVASIAGEAIDVEHVGSTAVPGLACKPIVDLAAVAAANAIDPLVEALVAAGWVDRGGGGEPGGRLVLLETAGGTRVAHLHVVAHGDPQWQWWRELRDRLLVDAEARARYAATKQDLAARHPFDRVAYTDGKDDVIGELRSGRVVEIGAGETHDLRRRVLRTGTPSSDVTFDGDDDPDTFHLGVRTADGRLRAISTWMHRPLRTEPMADGFQLRGMATEPSGRGLGAASVLLRAGVRRSAERGADVVWARARVTALDFYLRHGFVTVGDQYVDATTELPHVDIRLDLAGSADVGVGQ